MWQKFLDWQAALSWHEALASLISFGLIAYAAYLVACHADRTNPRRRR